MVDNQQGAEEGPIVKPTLSFESVTFSNGSTLTFAPDDIVVFVGPNNAGKSSERIGKCLSVISTSSRRPSRSDARR